jgi:NAD(P)-dependent dehydrogenase (short-subunit alcohol dehydrogenase family)
MKVEGNSLVSERLQDKVAIITGSAGYLGQSIAKQLDRAGVRLALFDRADGRLSKIFPEWIDSSEHIFIELIDLVDEEKVSVAVSRVVQRFGRIDILINAAGGYRAGEPTHETTDQDWNFMMDLNARTVLNVSRTVIPHMLEQSSGKVLNIAARPGLKGPRNGAAYAASKSAVMRLTESMSAELKHEGINVNAVLPGTIDTPANREQMPKANFDTWVSQENLSNVIRFLVSDEAAAIHGALIPVYGTG